MLKDVTRNLKSKNEIQRPHEKEQKEKQWFTKQEIETPMIEQQELHKNIGDDLPCSEWVENPAHSSDIH